VEGINCFHHLNVLGSSPKICSVIIHRKLKLISLFCMKTMAFVAYIRFESFPAVKIHIVVLWVIKPYSLVGRYRGFGGTYCQTLKMEQYDSPKRCYLPTRLYCFITQKTTVWVSLVYMVKSCTSCMLMQTNSLRQCPSCEANSLSDTEDIPCILWNRKAHYHVQKSSLLDLVLSKVN
jgi:hypothetical protein